MLHFFALWVGVGVGVVCMQHVVRSSACVVGSLWVTYGPCAQGLWTYGMLSRMKGRALGYRYR